MSSYADQRTRRDKTENRNKGFERQWPAMVDAYMAWSAELGESGLAGGGMKEREAEADDTYPIKVVDIFCPCS